MAPTNSPGVANLSRISSAPASVAFSRFLKLRLALKTSNAATGFVLRGSEIRSVPLPTSPSSNILTVELFETATATASVRLDTEAAATWQLPSPRGTSYAAYLHAVDRPGVIATDPVAGLLYDAGIGLPRQPEGGAV
jgi:hypothetical protein